MIDALAAPFPLRDMHEILFHAGRLWITCSYDNMLAVLDCDTGEWTRWYPLGETPEPPLYRNHLNSLAVVDGHLLVVAHNWGASELLRFGLPGLELRGRSSFGSQSHNIREVDGRLIACSSGEGALIDQHGWRLDVGGFPRGLWHSDDFRYVGISAIAERHERDFSEGRIDVFDAGWQLVKAFRFPREGLILDIQPFIRASAAV